MKIGRHELDRPDPSSDLARVERRLGRAAGNVDKRTTNLGNFFDLSRQLLGYRAYLRRPPEELVDALGWIVELGVGLFRRAAIAPSQTVTLTVGGQQVALPGDISYYNSAPRWVDATCAALVLRDTESLQSLCGFDFESFLGDYDAYHQVFARALASLHRGEPDVVDLLEEARAGANGAQMFPERGRRIGVPTIQCAEAIVAGDEEAFNARLADGLDWYRTLYQRPDDNTDAAGVIPLRYLGLAALAHDRGLMCRVLSPYVPLSLVEGRGIRR